MKKRALRFMICIVCLALLVGLVACKPQTPNNPDHPDNPDDPNNPDNPDNPDDPIQNLTDKLSERGYRIVNGSALHADGDLPEGFTESINRYITEYDAYRVDGAKTVMQTSKKYSDESRLNIDGAMVYADSKEAVDELFPSWRSQRSKYSLSMMCSINRAKMEYWSAHRGEILVNRQGELANHSGGENGLYFVETTDTWVEYRWEFISYALEKLQLDAVVFEEPDLLLPYFYSDAFKAEWKTYYGTAWEDPISSTDAMFKCARLRVHMMDRFLTEMANRIHEVNPDIKVYLACHSTPSYTAIAVTAGINTYMASGALDGLIGQTWTDTSSVKLLQNGESFVNEYMASFIGYASYVDVAGDLPLYTLTDPMGDGVTVGAGRREQDYRPQYFHNVVAELMQPEINRFEAVVWPHRAFESASSSYRTIQLAINSALREVAGKKVTLSAGTPGIAYLLSDSFSWNDQGSAKGWSLSSKNAISGVTLPLISDGIPLKIKAMEMVHTADDLADVRILLISWDCQKPLSEDVCRAIADWIKKGGVAVYVGGSDSFENLQNEWWASGGSPLQALLDMLELDIHVGQASITSSDRLVAGALAAQLTYKTTYNSRVLAFEGGDVSSLMRLGKNVVGIDQAAGEGCLIAVGIPSAHFAEVTGTDAMRALVSYACDHTDTPYESATLTWAKRGNVVAAHAFEKSALGGTFLNLFDEELTVHHGYALAAGESALLYDVTDLDLSVPRVAYVGGELDASTLAESADKTLLTVKGPIGTNLPVRILCRDGVYPQSVTVTNARGKSQEFDWSWDNETDALLVYASGNITGSIITVTWGDKKMDDRALSVNDEISHYEELNVDWASRLPNAARLTIPVDQYSLDDAAFILRDTALSNENSKFCDNDRELIYAFDLATYKNAVVALTICNNYVVDVSADGKNWTTIYNFEKVNGVRVSAATNVAVLGVSAEKYAPGAEKLYIRVRNSDTTKGWGAGLRQFTIYYEGKNPNVDPKNYAPTHFDSSIYRDYQSLFVPTDSAHAQADAEFLVAEMSNAAATASCKYCDKRTRIVWKFDLEKYPHAVVAFNLSQNYLLEVSTDGKNWTTVQNYEIANGSRINGSTNTACVAVSAEKYAKGAQTMYVRLSNSDITQGFGGRVSDFTLYYTHGEPVVEPETPVEPEEPEQPGYAPIDVDYDTEYADLDRLHVVTNLAHLDNDIAFRQKGSSALVSERNKYCDKATQLIYWFDLGAFPHAAISLEVAQNYLIEVSTDGQNWLVVQDYAARNGERIRNASNRTCVGIPADIYAKGAESLYIRLANADTTTGFGTAIYGFTVYYRGDEATREQLPPEDDDSYIPTVFDPAPYADYETLTVLTNQAHENDDAAFVVRSTAQSGAQIKYCDTNREIIYRFDLKTYKNAVVAMQISQNYLLQVSTDGENWMTVQNFEEVNGYRITYSSSFPNMVMVGLLSEKYAKDADALYVRLANSDVTKGMGGGIHRFTIYYQK